MTRQATQSVAVAMLAAMLAVACGSTVRGDATGSGAAGPDEAGVAALDPAGSGGLAAPSAGSNGLPLPSTGGGPAAATSAPPPAADGSTGAGASSNSSGSAGAGSAAAGNDASAGSSPAGSPPPPTSANDTEATTVLPAAGAPGVTDTQIFIGVTYLSDRDTGADVILGADVETPNPENMHNAMTAWVNATGGLAGREVVLVTRSYDTAEAVNDPATLAQSICIHFTEDEPVYAVFPEDAIPQLTECLAQRGVLTIGSDAVAHHDEIGFEALSPYLYYPGTLNLTRVGQTMGESLVEQGFYNSDSVIGVLYVDQPEWQRALDNGLKPALAAAGLQIAEEAAISGDLNQSGPQIASAALRFRARGVTHVSILEPQGVIMLLFTRQAESQAYRPLYGLNSGQFPEGLKDLFGIEQLRGSRGVGWNPSYDIHPDFEPAVPPRRAECVQIMIDAGLVVSDRVAEGGMTKTCDHYFFLRHVLQRATDMSAPSILTVVDSSGDSYQPALQLGAFHGPGFHDGAGLFVEFHFDDACDCFVGDRVGRVSH